MIVINITRTIKIVERHFFLVVDVEAFCRLVINSIYRWYLQE